MTLTPDQPTVSGPSVAFPIMNNLKFNLARVDNMDWRYSDSNLSVCQSLWQQVANNGDASGVACIYHFGGNMNKFPQSIVNGLTADSFYPPFFQNSLTYNGLAIWEALFQGFFKPLIQQVDSHPSTLGYGMFNEPNLNGQYASNQQLHNYYQYMTQRIRTISNKIVTFQATAGTAGGSSVPVISPSSTLNPIVFEFHDYQYNSGLCSSATSGANQAGITGAYWGEWRAGTQADMTSVINQAKTCNVPLTYHAWDRLLVDGSSPAVKTDTPTVTCQLLSQLYQSILGNGSW